MGAQELIYILLTLVKEYASEFNQSDVDDIAQTTELFLSLYFKTWTSEEEGLFQDIKNSLMLVLDKLTIAGINVVEDQANITAIMILLGKNFMEIQKCSGYFNKEKSNKSLTFKKGIICPNRKICIRFVGSNIISDINDILVKCKSFIEKNELCYE